MAATNSTLSRSEYSFARQVESGRKFMCPRSARPGPESYAVGIDGDCMLPDLQSGDIVICDPSQPPEPGDLVGIWWKNGSMQPALKKLVMSLPPREWWDMGGEAKALLCIEMLNPPTRMTVELSDVDAIHKVIHVIQN